MQSVCPTPLPIYPLVFYCIPCPAVVAAATAALAVEVEEGAPALGGPAQGHDDMHRGAGHSQYQPAGMGRLRIAWERLRDQAYIIQGDKTFEIVTVIMIVLNTINLGILW